MDDSQISGLQSGFEDSAEYSSRSNITTEDELFDQLAAVSFSWPTFLMPEKCQDEIESIEHMMHCLMRRYGNFPSIFVGKLEEALRDATKPQQIDQRSPLLIYVNNEKSVFTNFLFEKIFSREKIIDYLSENYLLWIWDIAFLTNCQKLNEIFKRAFPDVVNQILFKNEEIGKYPLFIGAYRNVKGEFCYDKLFNESQQDWKVEDYIHSLQKFKEKFLQCERDLEQRRETIREETKLKTAAMRRSQMGRFHSIHPHTDSSKHYRSYKSRDRLAVLTDPIMGVEADNFPDEFDYLQERMHRFECISNSSDEADDEEDDPEQTPTIECPQPRFYSKKEA